MLTTMGSECSILQLVIAITIASVLSQISLLLLLGRRDDLMQAMSTLTEGFTGTPLPCGAPYGTPMCRTDGAAVIPPRLPYRMYDDSLPAMPAATPAGDAGFGAPLSWNTPTHAPSRPPEVQSKSSGAPCFSHHYYL